jgi:hypothetical protein
MGWKADLERIIKNQAQKFCRNIFALIFALLSTEALLPREEKGV